jgi:hypothetical protein
MSDIVETCFASGVEPWIEETEGLLVGFQAGIVEE